MRYSDIKVGHVYYIDLCPVRDFEFGGHHMGIVLRKGHDKKTVTIISLTSKESGLGENKLKLGTLDVLPDRLKFDRNGNKVVSYLILDQVRTVAASRVAEIKDGKNLDGTSNIVQCSLDQSVFQKVVFSVSDFQMSNLRDLDVMISYHQNNYFNNCIKKIINLVYSIIRNPINSDDKKRELIYFYRIVESIDQNFSIFDYLNEVDKEKGIAEKLDSILSEVNN